MSNLHEGLYDHEDYFPFNRDDQGSMTDEVYGMSLEILDLLDEGATSEDQRVTQLLLDIKREDPLQYKDMEQWVSLV